MSGDVWGLLGPMSVGDRQRKALELMRDPALSADGRESVFDIVCRNPGAFGLYSQYSFCRHPEEAGPGSLPDFRDRFFDCYIAWKYFPEAERWTPTAIC